MTVMMKGKSKGREFKSAKGLRACPARPVSSLQEIQFTCLSSVKQMNMLELPQTGVTI